MKTKTSLFVVLITACHLLAIGQDFSAYHGAPFIHNFPKEEYKSDAQIWSMVQDKRGVMYFGNLNGVLEYDGKSWHNYDRR